MSCYSDSSATSTVPNPKYTKAGLLWIYSEELNFKTVPPPGDFKGYGQAILNCCKGDGIIHKKERAFVLGYFKTFGCPDDVLDYLSTYDAEVSMEEAISISPQLQMCSRAAIYDAVRACDGDGDLAALEVDAIKALAALVGVEEGTVNDIVAIHRAEQAVKTARLQITYPLGAPF